MPNENLNKAKSAKNDEFYTLPQDIDLEVSAYLRRNPDLFRGKSVLCPCDDPDDSAFSGYFAEHLGEYGITRLVCSCYNRESRGKMRVIENGITVDSELEGDGDFRGEEVGQLIDGADFVVTNPPFSLFRDIVAVLTAKNKSFSLIGNLNAIGYSEIFPLIMENRLWTGATHFNTGMYFRVPGDYEYAPTYKFDRERDGVKVMRVPATCWFTNIDFDSRHDTLELSSRETLEKKGVSFPVYDDYDAIEVSKAVNIPGDFPGIMGVPISWLGKYNPEQFEIVGIANHGKDSEYDLFAPSVHGETVYKRLLIRHRHAPQDSSVI